MDASTSNVVKTTTEITRTPASKKSHSIQTKLRTPPSMEDVIAPWSPRKQCDLRSEFQRLTEAFEYESPICEIPLRIEHDVLSPIPKKLVAQFIEGQSLPLSELNERLKKAFFGESEAPGHDLRIMISDLASRKYYGPKEANGQAEVDAFEDKTKSPFWFWETRTLAHISEELKTKTTSLRQKHRKMRDRVQALHAVLKLIEDDSHSSIGRKHDKKLHSALEKLDAVPDLDQINNGTPSGDEDGSMKRVKKRVKRESDVTCVMSCVKHQQEEAKLATASGFGTVKILRTAQTIFKNFVETPKKQLTRLSEFNFAGMKSVSCPEEKRLVYKSGDIEMMDEQLRKVWSPNEISQEFYNTHERLRLDLDRFKFVIQGAPPTWARKPSFEFSFQKECEQLIGLDSDKDEVVALRKKYLWFNSDSDCPPYYGPFQTIEGVSHRDPVKKVEALDYDEVFDEGWELDPEGESLSWDDEEDEEKLWMSDEDDESDAFIVEDGYLSEDEGMGAEMDIEDDLSISTEIEISQTLEISKSGLKESNKIDSLVKKSIKSGQVSLVSVIPTSQKTSDVHLLSTLKGVRIGKGKVSLAKKK